MLLKTGVKVSGIQPETVLAMMVTETVYKAIGVDLVITSIMDGKHMDGSLHYKGAAFDCRTRGISPEVLPKLRDRLAAVLGPEFDVVLEGDHVHVELDVKGKPTVDKSASA